MKLDHARAFVRQFARNAGESVYTPDKIDRAIQFVCSRFCRVTRCLPRVDAIVLTSGSPVVSLAGLPSTFGTRRLLSAYLTAVDEPLTVVDYEGLLRKRNQNPTGGAPTLLAWRDASSATLYPTPDLAYTLELRWWQPFTVFVPGCAGNIDLNLPDDVLAEILPLGPPAILQETEPEHAYGTKSWANYLAVEQSMKGAGSLGVQAVFRELED